MWEGVSTTNNLHFLHLQLAAKKDRKGEKLNQKRRREREMEVSVEPAPWSGLPADQNNTHRPAGAVELPLSLATAWHRDQQGLK